MKSLIKNSYNFTAKNCIVIKPKKCICQLVDQKLLYLVSQQKLINSTNTKLNYSKKRNKVWTYQLRLRWFFFLPNTKYKTWHGFQNFFPLTISISSSKKVYTEALIGHGHFKEWLRHLELDLEKQWMSNNFSTKPEGQNLHCAHTGQKFVKSFNTNLVKSLL